MPPKRPRVAFDTEATGLDFWHGCLPYSMQFCEENGTVYYFAWDVDPSTRIPRINPADIVWICAYLTGNRRPVLHNAKVDYRALWAACDFCGIPRPEINWGMVEDTLIKSHVWKNNWSHSLKDLRDILLGVSRRKQDALKHATHKARNICRTKAFIEAHGVWRIASDNDPHWPGVTKTDDKAEDIGGWWICDTWLPAAIAKLAPAFLPPERHLSGNISHHGSTVLVNQQITQVAPENHSWNRVSKEYGIEDVETTLVLNEVLDRALEDDGLTHISQERHRLLEITWDMETTGVHVFGKKLRTEITRYQEEVNKHYENLMRICPLNPRSKTEEPYNPDSDMQTRELLFNLWGLPVLSTTAPSETYPQGQPQLTAPIISKLLEEELTDTDPHGCVVPNLKIPASVATDFLTSYITRNRNLKSIEYLTSYWHRAVRLNSALGLRIHPSINITGTGFTRQSTNYPNLQNVGTGKEVFDENGEKYLDYLLRVCFGPPPGYEWLSIDLQSVEYLIWGFASGNQAVKETYEKGEPLFRPIMEALWGYFDKDDKKYKKCKNGIYSRIYGARESHADKTFGKEGAVKLIESRMPEIRPFTQRLHKQVKHDGYITTLGGYRLYVSESEPHKAVSAYIQGHAGWVIGQAMIKCNELLREYNANRPPAEHVKIILQIHDELIFEGPVGFTKHLADSLGHRVTEAGEQYGIPTPINKSLISSNWGEAVTL